MCLPAAGRRPSSLNVRRPAALPDVLEQHFDEEARLLGVCHPHDAAHVARRRVVSGQGEAVAHVHCVLRLRAQVVLQRLQPQALVSNVDKDVIASIERTERHVGLQLVLHRQRNVLEHLVDGVVGGDDADGALFSQHLDAQLVRLGALHQHLLCARKHVVDVALVPPPHHVRLPQVLRHKLEALVVGRHAQQVVALAAHDVEAVGHLLGQLQPPKGVQQAGQPPFKHVCLPGVPRRRHNRDLHLVLHESNEVPDHGVVLVKV
mmetsp:Transcript_1789/g.4741  ORF Transcript_1789/g.4741 Transcript_1789/m.4741 type:complete len:262 (-) Transcript_1789:738-1523(-)